MSDHVTTCVDATTAWAGVLAFLVEARLVLCAVGAENTLRTTMWGSSKVSRKTRTDAISVYHLLRTKRPAKASSTRVRLLIFKQLFFSYCGLLLEWTL